MTTKHKENELIYHVLMHHLNHYLEVKKIFKIDYDSQMILLTVYSHLLHQTIKPSMYGKNKDNSKTRN